ncbi:MAG: hypothetical protein NTZ78_04590 [Candidatus Aureabacteria bacterium]|nr:hypothetical protein [Candidatus Auribacterota bacterium]
MDGHHGGLQDGADKPCHVLAPPDRFADALEFGGDSVLIEGVLGESGAAGLFLK